MCLLYVLCTLSSPSSPLLPSAACGETVEYSRAFACSCIMDRNVFVVPAC